MNLCVEVKDKLKPVLARLAAQSVKPETAKAAGFNNMGKER